MWFKMEELSSVTIRREYSSGREKRTPVVVVTPVVCTEQKPNCGIWQYTRSSSHPELTRSPEHKQEIEPPINGETSTYDREVFRCPQMHDKDSLVNLSPLELMARHQRMRDTFKEIEKHSRRNLS
ncbi:uncharacterized protein [Centruroides vittatus]|uniref:uncharacterized protein n=1 Tax=Centruroides vittatus TaxID=120091 RepID=UPI0035100EFA